MKEAGGFETVRGKSLKTPVPTANVTALGPLVGQVGNDLRGFSRLLRSWPWARFGFFFPGPCRGARGAAVLTQLSCVCLRDKDWGHLENQFTIRPPKSSLLTKPTLATSPGLGTAILVLSASMAYIPGAGGGGP